MGTEKINLTVRLQKIADLVPCVNQIADIGTDHAYLPIYLVKCGKIKRAIASDIKKGPVLRAEKNVKRYDLEKFIDIRLGAGLKTVKPQEADAIIVAGMGGILISDILAASSETVSTSKLLVLQPMTAVKELREFLCENNFGIQNEYVVAEGNKLYNIITAIPNGKTSYTKEEFYLGRGIEETSPDLYNKYKEAIMRKITKKISGLKKSDLYENVRASQELQELLEMLS